MFESHNWRMKLPKSMRQNPFYIRYRESLILTSLGFMTLALGIAITIGAFNNVVVLLGMMLDFLGVLLGISGGINMYTTYSCFQNSLGAREAAENIHLVWCQVLHQEPELLASTCL